MTDERLEELEYRYHQEISACPMNSAVHQDCADILELIHQEQQRRAVTDEEVQRAIKLFETQKETACLWKKHYNFRHEEDTVANYEQKINDYDLAITALRQMQGWIPCSERLPEDYVNVLTVDKKGNMHIFNHFREFKYPFCIDPYHTQYFQPTHWRYLPERPRVKVKGEKE